MEMTGNCHICGRPTTSSCSMCGLITCEKHLKDGVCVECRKGTETRSRKTEREDRRYDDSDLLR